MAVIRFPDRQTAVEAAAAILATLAVTEARENDEACLGRMFGLGTVESIVPFSLATASCSALFPMRPRSAVQLESTTPVRTLLAESAAEPAISVT